MSITTRLCSVLFAASVACSSSPERVDTCGPLTEPTPVCGAPADWLGLSSRIWSAHEDCDDETAITVSVVDYEIGERQTTVGLAWPDERRIEIEATAYAPEIVLAHEVGHVHGLDHEEGDPCLLMSPHTSLRACSFVGVAGCEYGVGNYAPGGEAVP